MKDIKEILKEIVMADTLKEMREIAFNAFMEAQDEVKHYHPVLGYDIELKDYEYVRDEVFQNQQGGRLIQMIKFIRGRYNVGLKEAKDIVEAIRNGA